MKPFSLTCAQKSHIIDRTQYYIQQANQLMKLELSDIDIVFDLKGKASGMFVVKPSQIYIRYNEIVFSQYFEDAAVNTVAHEVAHYVVFSIFGGRKVKPHGREWKHVMSLFKLKPEVTSRYDVSCLPLKRQKRFSYICGCMTHQLSTTRHNKIQLRKMVYLCRQCRQLLRMKA